eukprot:CAMPEP_0170342532 /NCGR_PEP_ID=MMETSP0116_2-20130129/72425_1 /TAXON_ID=400756 /ORGANISM="Durinskia baltica, Strain CSIRO CS-38" /LENGTH=111 /DNA_ID=CAMNT_0010596153 /DNA_START=47 /DNA_END=379 /DNA_ORIENTATION=+
MAAPSGSLGASLTTPCRAGYSPPPLPPPGVRLSPSLSVPADKEAAAAPKAAARAPPRAQGSRNGRCKASAGDTARPHAPSAARRPSPRGSSTSSARRYRSAARRHAPQRAA